MIADQTVQTIAANLMMMGEPCVFCRRRATPSTGKRRWIGLERHGEARPAHLACARRWAGVVARIASEQPPAEGAARPAREGVGQP